MQFLLSDTFTTSLARLTGDEQKAVKTTAFDLQMNPANPSLSFHKLDRARDKNFWSVRVNLDIRIIVHRTDDSLMLCYVDHHDKAYAWAERRKLETHPKTGAAQFVEIRERVIEVPVITQVQTIDDSKLFDDYSDDQLLSFGVPEEWLQDVRMADEESLLLLVDYLPAEAGEALLEIATGGTPIVVEAAAEVDPFEHPDALRRFRVLQDIEELERALDYPWDKWSVFLHPTQSQIVERDYNGPARVSGSAGTGKTVVALHRAVYLTKQDKDNRVLLTTFSDALANNLRIKLRALISNQPRIAERLEIFSMDALGVYLYEKNVGKPKLIDDTTLKSLLKEESDRVGLVAFSQRFLLSEWNNVVDAWQLKTWDAYRDAVRLGRKTRLPEQQGALIWNVFDQVWQRMDHRGLVTLAGIYSRLIEVVGRRKHPIFDHVVVDEAQDISVMQLRFLSVLASNRTNGLFFAGDLGQRIFQQPFSWLSQGVDIRGRSKVLNINYRTSHQIRRQADLLLDPEITDVDGIVEERSGTISIFNGPQPIIKVLPNQASESNFVATWLKARVASGVPTNEIAVIVRSESEWQRAVNAVEGAGLPHSIIRDNTDTASDHVSICTMHLAKGLEFRAVCVMACDDEVLPSQERIELAADEADLSEIYNTERHLLYVACTRAREHLLVTGTKPASEFLGDFSVTQ
jgi:hypothetical protein